MSAELLQPGDRIYHPVYGFGRVEEVALLEHNGQATSCYHIRLAYRGHLTVPVDSAIASDLRLLVNSLAHIAAVLHTPSRRLSSDFRQRGHELAACSEDPHPDALAQGVRDLVCWGRGHALTPGDRRWLSSAQERLSAEIALVDAIELFRARAAMQREVDRLRTGVVPAG